MLKKAKQSQQTGTPGNHSICATAADGESPTGGREKRVKKIPAKLRDSYRESDASDGYGGLVHYSSEDDNGNGSVGFDVYNDDEDEASDEAGNFRKHKKWEAGCKKLGLKRARQGSKTANAGKNEGAKHALRMEVWTSATAHSENEAGKSDSYYEWEETANGFKRKRISTQKWTVSLFACCTWPRNDTNMTSFF